MQIFYGNLSQFIFLQLCRIVCLSRTFHSTLTSHSFIPFIQQVESTIQLFESFKITFVLFVNKSFGSPQFVLILSEALRSL